MIVAITQRNDKNNFGSKMDSLENNYVKYLSEFGIQLVPVPNVLRDVAGFLSSIPVDAIILSGGNDIHPKLYGSSMKATDSVSSERDRTESEVLDYAVKSGLPVLGICRGMQFINVFFGGKIQILDDEAKHVRTVHKVEFVGKVAKRTWGDETDVNSYHGQAVSEKTLADGIEAFAVIDGLVEGLYHPKMKIAGVQWHPERESPDEKANQKLLNMFIRKEGFWA